MFLKKIRTILLGLAVGMAALAGTAAAAFPALADTTAVEAQEIQVKYWIYDCGMGWSVEAGDNTLVQSPANTFVNAIWLTLTNQPADVTGTIEYQVNLSGSGWLPWKPNATSAGDHQGTMPLEAVKVRLTGQLAEQYDVYYSVFQSGAWTDLVMNGETAGLEAQGRRVDGLRVAIRRKGAGAPGAPLMAGRNIDPSKPMIALTFDDGPSAATTPILNALEAHGARATFYMVGNRMNAHQDVVRRMAAMGNEIGSHTWDHTYLTRFSTSGMHNNLATFDNHLQAIAGVRSVTMRPPGGFYSASIGQSLAGYGVPAIHWTIDTLDWKHRNPQTTVDTVLSRVQDGDIILMHDLYGTTASAAEILIPELIARGYQLVTVSELASLRGGMQPGQMYKAFRP